MSIQTTDLEIDINDELSQIEIAVQQLDTAILTIRNLSEDLHHHRKKLNLYIALLLKTVKTTQA